MSERQVFFSLPLDLVTNGESIFIYRSTGILHPSGTLRLIPITWPLEALGLALNTGISVKLLRVLSVVLLEGNGCRTIN